MFVKKLYINYRLSERKTELAILKFEPSEPQRAALIKAVSSHSKGVKNEEAGGNVENYFAYLFKLYY